MVSCRVEACLEIEISLAERPEVPSVLSVPPNMLEATSTVAQALVKNKTLASSRLDSHFFLLVDMCIAYRVVRKGFIGGLRNTLCILERGKWKKTGWRSSALSRGRKQGAADMQQRLQSMPSWPPPRVFIIIC